MFMVFLRVLFIFFVINIVVIPSGYQMAGMEVPAWNTVLKFIFKVLSESVRLCLSLEVKHDAFPILCVHKLRILHEVLDLGISA